MFYSLRPPQQILDLHDVEQAVLELTWAEQRVPHRIGLEVEAFAVKEVAGVPNGRLPLRGDHSVLRIARSVGSDGAPIAQRDEDPFFPTLQGGRITFEPGGQIEHSTAPHSSTAALRSEIDDVWDVLEARFRAEEVALVPLGVDPWHGLELVPQQLKAGRYQAMDRYFAETWPSGATMMRNTCAIQVNLEGGSGSVREERWVAANLLSPLLTAMFACSPGPSAAKSARAQAWQSIDPTRTGLPSWSSVSWADPIRDLVTLALEANVMFMQRGDSTIPLPPGFTFASWVTGGDSKFGRPTVSDLSLHLSTLFPEVRPRNGVIEMRGIDSLPRRWWLAPGVICAGLLYDDQARSSVIENLAGFAPQLRAIWVRSAALGLADPELRVAAAKLGHLGLEAAARQEGIDNQSLSETGEFLQRFTLQGLSPADELSARISDRRAAMAWATASLTEPVR